MFKSQTGTFTKTSFGQSLFKSLVGTIVKFCCRVFDRDPNCNIQENVRCKFFEKISRLIISIIQIPDSFLDLLLTFVSSSRELTGSYGVSGHTWVNFLTTNLFGMSQEDQIQLGPQFYLFKNRENDQIISQKCRVKKVDQHCYTDQQNE